MQIQSGKLYKNRTWRYLYPSLKIYGKELMTYLSQFLKISVGIGDSNVETKEPCIFILIDTNMAFKTQAELDSYKNRFANFLNWLKYQSYYVTDYVYDGLDSGGEKHMIVLRLSYKHDLSYLSFIKGKYSEMYKKSDIYNYFKAINLPANKPAEVKLNKELEETRGILFKENKYISKFAKIVNDRFGTDNPDSDFIDAELDFPPELIEEVFNYKEEI